MGFISRKILPACGSMCVCCPALRPSSRRPVKRYKKLLAEIFPKTIDGPPNERKITKLCEYAAKNPHRIPKIAKFLEQRSYKELRTENVNFIRIITEIYCKLLYICKEQMAYIASSLLNVIVELLNHKKQEAVQILGCQTLTSFIYTQADSTYAHNIESLIQKVCMLACEDGDEHRRLLRTASSQCLSATVWFMTEYSHIFTDFDEALHVAGQVAGTSVSTSPLPYGAMASQCDALGMGMRKKLSTWLVDGHDSVPDAPLPTLLVSSRSGIAKIQMAGYESKKKVSEQLPALRLPPASPFDNFMRAAGC